MKYPITLSMSIKNKILQKIDSLKIEIKELKEISKPISPENSIGRFSRMDAINNKTINDRMLRKSQEKLKKLELALSRTDDPNFRKCIVCKKAIQQARLELMPESTKCVLCAQKKYRS